MKKNNQEENKSLEAAIGDIGGVENETKSLGKIKLSNTQQKLTPEEEARLEAFKNRSREQMQTFQNVEESNNAPKVIDINRGWVPINREEMGIRSVFYPESYSFRVRQASVNDIKNWSAIDDKDFTQVNDALNEIMQTCVAIYDDGEKKSWEFINSWDRFWFLLKVREVTFANGNYNVEFTDSCPECDHDLVYHVTSGALHYELPEDDIIADYWDAEHRTWNIDPQEYDLDEEPITLYVPTLGKDAAILRWARAKYQETGKRPNEVFLKFLPWLLSKAPKDDKVLDKFIRNCQATYERWSTDMFGFMDSVIPKITVVPSTKLQQCCPYCGEEVTSNLDFPDGLKRLFFIQGKYRKFGEKRSGDK